MWFWRASQHRTSSTSEQLKHANDVFTCGARAGRVANLNGRFCFGFSATFFEYDGETGEGGQTVGGYSPRLGPLSLLCGSGRAHNRPASCGCSVVPPFRGETECAEHAIRDPTYYVEHNLDVAHISPVGTHVRHTLNPLRILGDRCGASDSTAEVAGHTVRRRRRRRRRRHDDVDGTTVRRGLSGPPVCRSERERVT